MTSFAMVEGVTVEEMAAAMTPTLPVKKHDVEVSDGGVAKRNRRKPEAEED